jgi:hypothetical protein
MMATLGQYSSCVLLARYDDVMVEMSWLSARAVCSHPTHAPTEWPWLVLEARDWSTVRHAGSTTLHASA